MEGFTCDYQFVKGKTEAKKVGALLKADTLGLDIETFGSREYKNHSQGGLSPHLSKISLIQIYDYKLDKVFIFDCKKLEPSFVFDILNNKTFTAHNALFEILHLKRQGIEILCDCSMVMYSVFRTAKFAELEEEEKFFSKLPLLKKEHFGASLKAVALKVLGLELEKEAQLSDWSVRPLTEEQLDYAAKDAKVAYLLFDKLFSLILKYKSLKAYSIYKKSFNAVASMIYNGCKFDIDVHSELLDQWNSEQQEAEDVLKQGFGEVNFNSVKQLTSYIKKECPKFAKSWPKSEKSGYFKTDAETLKVYKDRIPFVHPLLLYKKKKKLTSTYGESFQKLVNPETKRMHCSYTIGFTKSGRLSSRYPNLQNIVRGSDLRRLFIPEKGNCLIGADYSQIEVRVAANLSQDEHLLNAYRQGKDIHTITAQKVLRRNDITKEERQQAKAVVFGSLFGMGARSFVEYAFVSYGVLLTEVEAKEKLEQFFNLYPAYWAWQKRKQSQAKRINYSFTEGMRVRKLTDKNSYTCSLNHPIQGTAAEIILKALTLVYEKSKDLEFESKLCNCIHDEILLEVPFEYAEKGKNFLVKCMIEAYLDVFPYATTLNLVEAKSGDSWFSVH